MAARPMPRPRVAAVCAPRPKSVFGTSVMITRTDSGSTSMAPTAASVSRTFCCTLRPAMKTTGEPEFCIKKARMP